ncbi:MAG TPA: hypothetical protein VLK65_11120 [Vicinamibacteria bacterium]|nr:hypothetical protein [Vicinamibacteria bacterium]
MDLANEHRRGFAIFEREVLAAVHVNLTMVFIFLTPLSNKNEPGKGSCGATPHLW